MRSLFLFFTTPALASAAQFPPDGIIDAATCSQLASQIALPNVTVNFAQYVSAGANISTAYADPAYNTSSCNYTDQMVAVDLCRVAMAVGTSSRSGMFVFSLCLVLRFMFMVLARGSNWGRC